MTPTTRTTSGWRAAVWQASPSSLDDECLGSPSRAHRGRVQPLGAPLSSPVFLLVSRMVFRLGHDGHYELDSTRPPFHPWAPPGHGSVNRQGRVRLPWARGDGAQSLQGSRAGCRVARRWPGIEPRSPWDLLILRKRDSTHAAAVQGAGRRGRRHGESSLNPNRLSLDNLVPVPAQPKPSRSCLSQSLRPPERMAEVSMLNQPAARPSVRTSVPWLHDSSDHGHCAAPLREGVRPPHYRALPSHFHAIGSPSTIPMLCL